jgi:hypothetical protein
MSHGVTEWEFDEIARESERLKQERPKTSVEQPTGKLRWLGNPTPGAPNTLQQEWSITIVDDLGRADYPFTEWRDVPVEWPE